MPKLEDDVDALFQLPLAEFIGARKTLAARLKKDGHATDAERIKLLAKPSISAWAVNQLYWHHRDAFDRLVATGRRFHKAQESGKLPAMREALDDRRQTLSELTDLATTVLDDAGHNPSTDTVRRITSTLEAMSAYASLAASEPDRLVPGRLTADVDPPGFESFGSFTPSVKNTNVSTHDTKKVLSTRSSTAGKASDSALSTQQSALRTKLAAAKIAVQNAKKSLTAARSEAQNVEARKKKADAAAREAESHRREAEARFKKATAASEAATERAQIVAAEMSEAAKALDDAKRAVETTTKELESLFREKPSA